jgi:multiple sugar transport system substrate-binding protein
MDEGRLGRREILVKALRVCVTVAIVAAVVATGLFGNGSTFSVFAADGLKAGNIGGPTGFTGAERYQYTANEAAGRAIQALKALKAAGKAPDQIVMMMPPGCVGHWEKPFPEGAKAVKDVFKEETGIEIVPVDVVETEQMTKLIQDYQTGARSYDVYSYWSSDTADVAASGALYQLDDLVKKYKPDWTDPEFGFVGGDTTLTSTSKVSGHIYNVLFDGDYQIWVYRNDLFQDPKEKAAFKAKYGWDLQWPETWKQLDQVSEFFNRPDKGLLGCTDLRNQYWGFTNWYMRYLSFGNPNQYFFDENTGKPLIDSEAGIQATREIVESMKWHHKDGLSWGWPEQYANFAAGGAAITCAFPNMPKFLDNPGNKDSKIVGKIRTGLAPGRIINGKLIRRAVWWPSIGHGVAANTKYPEAVYLFLQWASSGRIYTWMTGNPAGYYDPVHVTDFKDPVVVGSYHAYHIPVYIDTIKHSGSPINIPGVTEYVSALDTNLQEALTGHKTPEQAMKDTAAAWEKITDAKGRAKQIEAIRAAKKAFSTVVDSPTIK